MAVTEAIPTEEFETQWTNYGDVNPEEHGGRFVRWNDGHWEVIETYRASEVIPDGDPEEQVVSTVWVYPDEVWVNGNPEEGFTSAMENILESLHENGGHRGPSPEPDSPRFMTDAAFYIADMTHWVDGGTDIVEYDDYDDLLAKYGVDDYE